MRMIKVIMVMIKVIIMRMIIVIIMVMNMTMIIRLMVTAPWRAGWCIVIMKGSVETESACSCCTIKNLKLISLQAHIVSYLTFILIMSSFPF